MLRSNFCCSALSLANAFAVRMPLMPLSIAALISAVFLRSSTLACFMRTRWRAVNHRHGGRITSSVSASSQRMVNMTISAPTSVTVQMMMFSGPWWASSVMSKRSLVTRESSAPVRLWSKKLKLSVCMCANTSRRISASTSTPTPWPTTVMT